MTQSQPTGTIHGIDCKLLNDESREWIQAALDRIHQNNPTDFARIQSLLRAIQPIEPEHAAADIHVLRRLADGVVESIGEQGHAQLLEQPCTILIDEDEAELYFAGCLVHELGHVCTTRADLENHPFTAGEMNFEVAACRYMHVWGFHDEIDGFWQVADNAHYGLEAHCVLEHEGRQFRIAEDYQLEAM